MALTHQDLRALRRPGTVTWLATPERLSATKAGHLFMADAQRRGALAVSSLEIISFHDTPGGAIRCATPITPTGGGFVAEAPQCSSSPHGLQRAGVSGRMHLRGASDPGTAWAGKRPRRGHRSENLADLLE